MASDKANACLICTGRQPIHPITRLYRYAGFIEWDTGFSQMRKTPPPEVHFGSPGQTPGHLRNTLAERIAAVPAGGTIDWVTYYFRDLCLAKALVQAHKRGVRITLTLEGRPRIPYANDAVIALLSGPDGLGDALRIVTLPGVPSPATKSWKPQLHEKLYCFSHPEPVAFIGSFNPSGNGPEDDPEIIREIGDQDRGYNALIGLKDPVLVEKLAEHARQLHQSPPGLFYRFTTDTNNAIHGTDTDIYFWPRTDTHPIVQFAQNRQQRTCPHRGLAHPDGKCSRHHDQSCKTRGRSGNTGRIHPQACHTQGGTASGQRRNPVQAHPAFRLSTHASQICTDRRGQSCLVDLRKLQLDQTLILAES